jgi:hypothetical protein
MRLAFVVFAILAAHCAPLAAATQAVDKNGCTTSKTVADRPPDDPNASSFASPNGTWYANESRTVWAWWWGKRQFGDYDYKALWVRPVGTRLSITGHRIDESAPPLTASIPDGYGRYTFEATSISFPTAGCWEVHGIAGNAQLSFVVRIP